MRYIARAKPGWSVVLSVFLCDSIFMPQIPSLSSHLVFFFLCILQRIPSTVNMFVYQVFIKQKNYFFTQKHDRGSFQIPYPEPALFAVSACLTRMRTKPSTWYILNLGRVSVINTPSYLNNTRTFSRRIQLNLLRFYHISESYKVQSMSLQMCWKSYKTKR